MCNAFALLITCLTSVALAHGHPNEEPRIERVTFRGVEAMDEQNLRESIVTRETRCRGLLLQPICWFTDGSVVVEQHFLDSAELERDRVRLRVFYYRRGYRDTDVDVQVLPRGDGVEVVFDVHEGVPTRIRELEVLQTRDVLTDREIRRARFPGAGDALNLVEIELGIAHLEERLGAAGYLDAVVRDSIAVRSGDRLAYVAVVVDPGHRATLDELDVQGNDEVEIGTIASALRLRSGGVLRRQDLVAARRSLYESNLFHEVRVHVPAQPDSAKRVVVNVREAPPRSMRLGGGFNTIEFFQLEARFTHYNWLGGGRRFTVRGTLGNLLAEHLNGQGPFRDVMPADLPGMNETAFVRPTWQTSIGLLQPAFRSAENVLGMEVFFERRTIPGIVVDRGLGGEISITRRLDHGMPLSGGYTHELTTVEAGDLYFCVNYGVCDPLTIEALKGRHRMSPISVGFQRDRADFPIAPSSGHRMRVDVEHASGLTYSDYRYNRISGEGSYYYPFDVHRRRVLAGRVRIGWVRPLPGTAAAIGIDVQEALLHPRKRFYAGGSRSVRGYGENQLGPRILTIDPVLLQEAENGCSPQEIVDRTCDPHVAPADVFLARPTGGTAVFEASVEYRFPFVARLTGAVFVDGGMVGEGPGELFARGSWAVTPGFGVRLASPVGPVRLDLGIRPSIMERLPVVTEFEDEDGVRHLVELETRRRYNPVDVGGGGFFREILSRLALHLSIGEAY